MVARFRQFLSGIGETFWLIPAVMVVAAIVLAFVLVHLDSSGVVPDWLVNSPWLYSGGGTGARTLLGAVASSTIGVAGTVFSITIAALSLAAGQMGPRLLRNFTRDRGNQVTLGTLLGTFSYALLVLRSVRTQGEGPFVPHLALSVAIVMAFVCVGMLVFFVGHMAGRINVDTVIELVSRDVSGAIHALTFAEPQRGAEDAARGGVAIADERRGYLQHVDADGLADWAAAKGATLHLLVRAGDFVFPGAPIARIDRAEAGAGAAIVNATALGPTRVSSDDLEYSVRQLVEVAVRALSPGINDPHTAIAVLDRLGAALCELAPRHLAAGAVWREGRAALTMPVVDYDGLADTMFHTIRQNAAGSATVLVRMLEVLTAVASCEHQAERVATLRRHARLVMDDGDREIGNAADLADLRRRHEIFSASTIS